MRNVPPARKAVAVALLAAFASACISLPPSPKIRLYTLKPVHVGDLAGKQGGATVTIRPIRLADYLQRPQIVIRVDDHELSLSEFDRWAGALEEEISSALASHLSAHPAVTQTYPHALSGTPTDFQVSVEITRFDGDLGGSATLTAIWSVGDGPGGGPLVARRSTFVEPASGDGYGALVNAYGRCLKGLGAMIGDEIDRLARAVR